ncbi:ArsR family transcriptional regulator [[Mycobacterium] wendilense]|uniref:ArsR family transcriptional regulator n=2 Tax=[Mycobacterium] wendilense TaxID=3064284 RepID=A0ABN9P205_9MYCO|nr:helix-turn-helix domain-containing protein [Mycolicibacterium sp. MU0050]CAJ1580370.1 ArsR family transcriptional regulator [Mycolicibacterium sp. MU0050]
MHDTTVPDGLAAAMPGGSDRAAGRQRSRVLELVRAATEPVDARQVADALDIHVTTARFHLGTLEAQGAIRRGAGTRAGGAGRPRSTYELAPRLDYADIVALFAAHLGGTVEEREARAVRIGADLARRTRLTRARTAATATDLVLRALDELGFQTRSTVAAFGAITIGICTCPLVEIAVDAPEVVRGIQQGLIQEIIDSNREVLGRGYRVQVRPDAQAGSCAVSLLLEAGPDC